MSRMFRHTTAVAAAGLAGMLALAACSSSDTPSNTTGGSPSAGGTGGGGGATITFLVPSGSPADVTLIQNVVKPWEDQTGNKVEVAAAASDIGKELTDAFKAGTPPDLFFTDAGVFATYAKDGNLFAYGDQLDMTSDFYPQLVQTFTNGGKFYCAPTGFTTLALVINPDLWSAAGLTTTQVPTTWGQLETIAQKLTANGVKGLVVGDTIDRVGAFMRQAGGWIVNADQTRMTADTATNLTGVTEVQKLLEGGSAAYPKALGATTSAEAYGMGKAAMTIEDNTIKAVLKNSYPNTKFIAVELPAGPASKGTLAFADCYGIAAASKNQPAAVDLVRFLSTTNPSMQLAGGLGFMPPLRSAQQAFVGQFPSDKAFVAGVTYATPPVTVAGMETALDSFDAKLAGLPDADPKAMLQQLQKDGDAVFQQ
ncbi:ABC transporter substrate-binding protein [Monashia sp. NPDC004114]